MICPQCGALVEDNLTKCDNCNYEFNNNSNNKIETAEEFIPTLPALKNDEIPNMEIPKREKPDMYKVLMLILAVTIVILSFYGAHYISQGGINLNSMKNASVASLFSFDNGSSVSYYQNLGAIYYGFAYAVRSIGIGLAALVLAIAYRKQ